MGFMINWFEFSFGLFLNLCSGVSGFDFNILRVRVEQTLSGEYTFEENNSQGEKPIFDKKFLDNNIKNNNNSALSRYSYTISNCSLFNSYK
jgi:hypothetical protein